jgi:ribosomal protein S20
MQTNSLSLEGLGKQISEYQNQKFIKTNQVKQLQNKGTDTSQLSDQIKNIEVKIDQYQQMLKEKYKEIFPEVSKSPEDFWEAFLTL